MQIPVRVPVDIAAVVPAVPQTPSPPRPPSPSEVPIHDAAVMYRYFSYNARILCQYLRDGRVNEMLFELLNYTYKHVYVTLSFSVCVCV